MERRDFIKRAAMGYIGALLGAPAFAQEVAQTAQEFRLDAASLTLIEQVTEAILPQTEMPGATALKLADFLLLMVKDCSKTATQQAFVRGLQGAELVAQAKYQKSFASLDAKAREDVLREGLNGKGLPKDSKVKASDWKTFVNEAKRFTVMGFMQSQYVMTEVFPYALIPGPFQADVAIEKARF